MRGGSKWPVVKWVKIIVVAVINPAFAAALETRLLVVTADAVTGPAVAAEVSKSTASWARFDFWISAHSHHSAASRRPMTAPWTMPSARWFIVSYSGTRGTFASAASSPA